MECPKAQTLDAFLDGQLEALRSSELEQHLNGCTHCSQRLSDDKAFRRILKSESWYFKAPASVEKNIRRSVRQVAKSERPRWFSVSWLKIAVPLAAAALVIVLLNPRMRPSSEELLTQEVVSNHIRSLMVDHLADIPSSDQHTVKPWFNGKLDFSPPVSDLAKDGFILIGGRLEYLSNRPVAALVYQRDKHVINLFVWPSEETTESNSAVKTRQGYHVIDRANSGMQFWAISDLEENQLAEFIELAKSSYKASK
jgi:anti-sigma factor RsiW